MQNQLERNQSTPTRGRPVSDGAKHEETSKNEKISLVNLRARAIRDFFRRLIEYLAKKETSLASESYNSSSNYLQ